MKFLTFAFVINFKFPRRFLLFLAHVGSLFYKYVTLCPELTLFFADLTGEVAEHHVIDFCVQFNFTVYISKDAFEYFVDISLKDASKYFAGKFSCGSSVTGPDEIVIQGDCKDDLWDLITEKWPQVE